MPTTESIKESKTKSEAYIYALTINCALGMFFVGY